MALQFKNTLSHKTEAFHPIHEGKVGIYSCGPTVYQTASIGNFRSFIFADLLRRGLTLLGYEVKQIMNITDVGHLVGDGSVGEDKMIVAMQREGKTAWEIADFYTAQFLKDMDRLNILRPQMMPKATDHIEEQISFIEDLERNGYTYKTSDGIYFDTAQLPEYGQLSGQSVEDKEAGARVEENTEKRNPADFALWKFSPAGEKRHMEWESPWGVGFPGWHIECSAMSERYLDSPFDIHTGGTDHIPVHHENEIAQTLAARGNTLANYWLHGAFLLIDGGKMSKSLGNTYSIDDLMEKGFEPLAFRYFTLQAHYATQQNFTWEAVGAAQSALNNLRDALRGLKEPTEVDQEIIEKFRERIEDDIDAPGALAMMWEVLKSKDVPSGVKAATIKKMDQFFGLDLERYIAQAIEVPEEVERLLAERLVARQEKDWELSDTIRDQIAEMGFVVEDGPEGQKLRELH